MPEKYKKFRMRFVPPFTFTIILSIIGFSGYLFVTEGINIDWKSCVIALSGMLLFVLLYILTIIIYYKVTLTEDGIKGFNFWGKYRFVQWNEINNVKFINFCGLKFLRVFSKNERLSLWIPLFLKDMNDFKHLACTLPQAKNKFREYYSKNIDI